MSQNNILTELRDITAAKKEIDEQYSKLMEKAVTVYSPREIIEYVGVKSSTVTYYRKKHGMMIGNSNRNTELDPEIINIMKARREEGIQWGDIADELNDLGYKTARGYPFQTANARYIGLLHGVGTVERIHLKDDVELAAEK